jgi:hypothetical protein
MRKSATTQVAAEGWTMEASSGTATPQGATKPERVDFLKQIVSFTEGNIRSYDTKAQISLAAFVLSANPLVAISNSACSQISGRAVLMILVPSYFATILAYLWVLWPVAPPLKQLTEGLGSQDIFYIHDPMSFAGIKYVERLADLAVERELTAEALKLAHIRRIKAGRFKVALLVTLATYFLIAVAFFFVGRCF